MADALFVAILAAGASRRLGRPKQLVELRGETLVHRQCRVATEATIGSVAVVVGCKSDEVTAAVADLPVHVLINNEWEEGMAASVRTATRAAITTGASGLLLCHCDQYAITAEDLERLRDAWRSAPTAAHLSRAADYLGPPAILPASLFDAMLTLQGDKGPRAILKNARTTDVEMPNASIDLDDAADLLRMSQG